MGAVHECALAVCGSKGAVHECALAVCGSKVAVVADKTNYTISKRSELEETL
jgi:hypothetical protein